jgi:hypothetical protein
MPGPVAIIRGMPLPVTRRERQILSCLALLIILGLIGMAVL